MVKRILALALAFSFVTAPAVFASEGTIGHLFSGKPVVRVCVKEISNDSGQAQVGTEAFKAVLETSFMKRKAITFKIVNTAAESDIQLAASIKKFEYMVRGPLKPSIGIETTLLDAMATATENYAEMSVDFNVIDTKSGNILWEGNVEDYMKKVMTAEESIPLISDKICRKFLWICFGKANFRLRRGFVL